MFRATGLHLSSQATECDGFIANASNAVVGLGCIQMMLYFSLEDGSKKMTGTGRSVRVEQIWRMENLLQLLGASPSVRVNPY